MRLQEKTAFVTGGGSGIGAAICTAFAREGGSVFVTDIDEDAAANVAAECRELAGSAWSGRCDVTDSVSVREAFEEFRGAAGQLDILVNNAGILHGDPQYAAALNATSLAQFGELMNEGKVSTHWTLIQDLSDEQFDRMLKVHLYGTFYCTREALRMMSVGERGGCIINMGSIMGSASLAGAPDYCAAKGAIMAFTRATAREAASYNVRVNSIAPGFIDTPLLKDMGTEARRVVTAQAPMAREGKPEEVAAIAVFLASDDASFMTGQSVSPNGGIYMSQ